MLYGVSAPVLLPRIRSHGMWPYLTAVEIVECTLIAREQKEMSLPRTPTEESDGHSHVFPESLSYIRLLWSFIPSLLCIRLISSRSLWFLWPFLLSPVTYADSVAKGDLELLVPLFPKFYHYRCVPTLPALWCLFLANTYEPNHVPGTNHFKILIHLIIIINKCIDYEADTFYSFILCYW